MGTETKRYNVIFTMLSQLVKLNNPQMGTETELTVKVIAV